MPVLPRQEPAAVHGRPLISIPFATVPVEPFLGDGPFMTVTNFIYRVCSLAIGPGSPLLMLARAVNIEMPHDDSPVGQGAFYAESITSDTRAWRSAMDAAMAPRGDGTLLTVDNHSGFGRIIIPNFILIGYAQRVESPQGVTVVSHVRGRFLCSSESGLFGG